jgi:hypothetical protein
LTSGSLKRVPQHLYDGNLSAGVAVAILRRVAGSRKRAETISPIEPPAIIGDTNKTQ